MHVTGEDIFTNFEISIPVTIGTESDKNSGEHQMHQSNNEYPNISTFDNDDPLSYYSALK